MFVGVVVVDVGGGGLRWYNCNYDLSLYSFVRSPWLLFAASWLMLVLLLLLSSSSTGEWEFAPQRHRL